MSGEKLAGHPRRVAVVGTAGSGKTTFAAKVAQHMRVPHVELDALHWGPDWTPAPTNQFRQDVSEALASDSWVTDGNYSKVRDIVWQRADTLVWLDYSYPVVMARVTWRTLRRTLTREELWNQNRENFSSAIFSKDGIILWAMTTYHRRRRDYPALFEQPEHAHLRVVRLPSPRQARHWLAGLQ